MEEIAVTITLTRDEWCELANALVSKAVSVGRDDYGPEENPGDNDLWVATLHSAYDKVTKELHEKGVVY